MSEFVAYYRVSTQRQGDSGLGLEAQKASVERYVASVHGIVAAEFTEIESGKRVTRPQLDDAIKTTARIGATLIVAKLDRLARNTRYILKIRDTGIPVTFCDLPNVPDGAMGRFLITQIAAVAELEAGMISDRTKAALARAKLRGTKLGTNGRALARRNRGVAEAFARGLNDTCVRLGFDLKDFKIREAIDFLNTNAMLTPTGKPWNKTTAQRLLYRIRRIERVA